MASQVPTNVPSGNTAFIGIPDSEDIPRLVYCAPYFQQVPLAELIEPSVIEAVNNVLPSLVPPYVDQAAQAAVQAQAVLLVGSTMTGPLFLNPVMPTADAQAATKAYVDTMLSTAGIPEVPPVPSGQVWARETGQWVPISQTGGTFLPIAGGTMQGNIAMSGNTITNMAAVPAMPNGAAPAQWVLNQIASVSLYQGTWNADTNVPDLTQLSTHVNAYTWIALTTSPSGVVIGPAIPGLQGTTVFNGDTIIYSTVEGQFKAIHGGGITLPEADGRYVQLAGSQMSGALLLNANATQPLQATTLQQLDAAVANTVTPDAPADGQGYLRVGVGAPVARWVPGLPLAGGILTGALTLSGNATQNLQAVPLQQVNSLITAGTTGFLPLAGGQMTGLLSLSGNATANLNAVPLQQLNAMLQTYAPIQNPSFTGTVTLPGNAASALQAVPLQQVQSLITSGTAGYLPLTGGTINPGPLTVTGANSTLLATIGSTGNVNWMTSVGGYGVAYNPQAHLMMGGNGCLIQPVAPGGGVGLTSYSGTSGSAPGASWNYNFGSAGLANFMNATPPGFFSAGIFAPQAYLGTPNVFSSLSALFMVSNNSGAAAQFGGWSTSGTVVAVAASQPINMITFQNWTGSVFNAIGAILSNSTSVSYNTTSDDRLKTNQADITDAGTLIDQLQPITFNWDTQAAGAPLSYGFSAQATQPVFPFAVSEGIGNPGDENFMPWGMDLSKMVPLAIAELKALRARIAALESHAGVSPAVPVTA